MAGYYAQGVANIVSAIKKLALMGTNLVQDANLLTLLSKLDKNCSNFILDKNNQSRPTSNT